MAVASSRGRTNTTTTSTTTTELKKWKERETSPERTKVWAEPHSSNKHRTERKVAVVYYLSRSNGQLEQPHFMEVPLSSPEGLYLRDVINRLNLLRGKGMASMYSWSSKRSYKSGFVWHDLAESDFIYPAQGKDYVLKGSEILLETPSSSSSISKSSDDRFSSSFNKENNSISGAGGSSDFPAVSRRRNQSWAAVDFHHHEYKIYPTRAAADVSTQTDEKQQPPPRRRRGAVTEIVELETNGEDHRSTELSREEISPPPSDSSPETLEALMKSDGRVVLCPESEEDRTVENQPNGKFKASSVLMQLISCGSMSFKDCGPCKNYEPAPDQGFSLVSHYKSRVPRGKSVVEDKEYFSGSLVETKKKDKDIVAGAFKRSNSYNADRTSEMGLMEGDKGKMRGK